MFKQVVVGVDEHQGARDAIALAKRLLARDGELTLAHVYAGDPRTYHRDGAAYAAGERDRARELLERQREEAGVEACLRWRESPSAGQGLHELCGIVGADLLVVGSSRRGLLGRVLIGDDTRTALNGAPCAVAVAPAGYSKEPVAMREIGVGYNASPESKHALEVARGLAGICGAKLSAFEAVSLPALALLGGPAPFGDTAELLVDDARERIAALDGVEPHAAFGRPAEELALYSASLDLLIVGSRGYGPLGRLLHGSTSMQLVATARCPLLILRRATHRARTDDFAGDGRGSRVAART